jgi:choline dehydrogenase-like flavoprotein
LLIESNQWADLAGDKRWSWEGLLPYFKKTETFYPSKSNTANLEKYHGFDGPIKASIFFFVAQKFSWMMRIDLIIGCTTK